VLVREPDALAAHVRFDEGSVETGTTARPFRHRQTKGAETDTPGLTFTAPHSYSTAVKAAELADYAFGSIRPTGFFNQVIEAFAAWHRARKAKLTSRE
jgi:hypothetical protein